MDFKYPLENNSVSLMQLLMLASRFDVFKEVHSFDEQMVPTRLLKALEDKKEIEKKVFREM